MIWSCTARRRTRSASSAKVRRAGSSDEPAVLSILQEYYRAASVVARDDPGDLRKYLEGNGALWLATSEGTVVGCVALRPLKSGEHPDCEVKRLYVQPQHRGEGIAKRLYEALEAFARAAGFPWIYLDSTDAMRAAIRFYERHGFQYCDRYNDNPQATLFMRKRIA